MKKILLFSALVVFALTGCENPSVKQDPVLTLLSEAKVAVSESGDDVAIEFSTNNNWDAEVTQGSEWCSLDNYMGKKGDNVVVNATTIANNGGADREAIVRILSDIKEITVTISQTAHSEITIVCADTVKFLSVGGDEKLRFSSNKDWTIEIEEGADWLTLSSTEGTASNDAEVLVTAAQNDSKRRDATIKVNCGEKFAKVVYVQHPIPPVVEGDFSDWDCYMSTPNNAFLDESTLQVGDRYFTVNLEDPENYAWGVINEFSKSDFWIYSSSVIGNDGEQFKTTALRLPPNAEPIKGNMVVFLIDKNDGTPVFEEALEIEMTLISSGRLGDASKGEFVRIGDIEIYDRNEGEDVPSIADAPFALDFTNAAPEVDAEWQGDWFPWEDAMAYADANFADGWRMPDYYDCAAMKERLCYAKGHYFLASDEEDGKIACFMPQAGYESNPQAVHVDGAYWSSQTSEGMSQFAYYLGFSTGGNAMMNGMKYYGQSIRRVRTVTE